MPKILTVVGARPQFIKAAALSRALASQGRPFQEVLLHTGQHYDHNMSRVFFAQLALPEPHYNLGVRSAGHGRQTGQMLQGIEEVLLKERPQMVLVYGDTNSTLAGALGAAKLDIPLAHVEAGLRSHNRRMPEEINRVVSDRLADLLFCPSKVAVRNLAAEGITSGVHLVGDLMYDVCLFYREQARASSRILRELGLCAGEYLLATCHRQENTDDRRRLAGVVAGLRELARRTPVVWPLHPRTKNRLARFGLMPKPNGLRLCEPLPYLDMIRLEQSAAAIVTDSGGVQKEAYFFGVPCLTLRDETEWAETVESGWNRLVGCDPHRLSQAFDQCGEPPSSRPEVYGDGRAAGRVLDTLASSLG